MSNEKSYKFSKVLIFTLLLISLGIAFLVYVQLGQSDRSVPKITMSYFKTDTELVEAIHLRLSQEMQNEKQFWIGVEPTQDLQLPFVKEFAQSLQSKKKFNFTKIFIDQELELAPEYTNSFGDKVEIISIKENWFLLQEKIKLLDQEPYLVLTASIYSNPAIKMNPFDKIFKESSVKPMTFSLAYFPMDTEDEKKNLFQCLTEDKTGTSDWGCRSINRARIIRRKINRNKIINEKTHLISVVDLIGAKDYMILLNWPNTPQ